MGTATWTSPLHYDTDLTGPGIHADFNFNPGVGQVHTILSIDVAHDAASPYDRVSVTHTSDHTIWVSPVMPVGSGTITKGQVNAVGFTVMEDIGSITALRTGSAT